MKIKRIEASKYVQERVLVYPEEGEPLRITRDELLQFGLHKGMDLPEELVVELKKFGRSSSLRAKGAQLASGRMLSKKELGEKLKAKGATGEEAAEIAAWLEELGAVDEAAYAGILVRHYAAAHYGRHRVEQELQRRGIPHELWEEALQQLPQPHEAIGDFIAAKHHGKSLDFDGRRKLAATLQRRGFDWHDIRPVLNALGEEICE
ncbi:MAG: regulatory protein RecX [Oscillospiraceae bacterium]|nr:regulatory protein RecX [Oscillospiraceae bacterium]